MKKTISSIILLALGMFFLNSCAKIDSKFNAKSSSNTLTSLMIRYADGRGGYNPTIAEPYPEAITVEIPWYYPDGTYNETSLDSLFISGSIPNNAYISPAFGLADFTSPRTYNFAAQNGTAAKYTITVVRKRSSKKEITAFKLNEADIDGIVVNDTVVIPYTVADLASQTATVELSNYAKISPDPAIVHNYNNPVTYTVTADDGSTFKYTVKVGIPVKIAKGISRVKKMWSRSAGDLGFVDYAQISMAVSGDYLVLPTSNEWAGGSELKYYNRKTGAFAGNMNVGNIDGLYSIANDKNGKLVGINNLYAGANVCLYKWDNVTSAPVLLARSTDWSSVGSAFYGRKISVFGDLNGDAVIMATTDGSNAGGANNILKWTITNGAIVSADPQVIKYPAVFGYAAKAIPAGPLATDPYYFCSNLPSFMTYLSGTGNTVQHTFSQSFIDNPRGLTPALTYFEFNNAKFAAVVDASEYSSAMHIFDVTDPTKISTAAGGAGYTAFHVFDGSNDYLGCPSPNWNVTAEIAYGQVSSDGFTIPVYFMVTNGGIVAYEVSCIAF